MHFFHHTEYFINVPCRKKDKSDQESRGVGGGWKELEEGIGNIVSVSLENDSKPETTLLLSTEVEKSYMAIATVLFQQGTFLPRKMKDILPVPGPCMTLLQSEVTKGWLVMIGCYSWGNTKLQSIPQQSIRYTELSFSPSAAAWHPSGPPSPACKLWWAYEDSSVGWNGDQWLAVLLGRRAGGANPLELSSSAVHFKFPLWYYIWHSIWNPKLL